RRHFDESFQCITGIGTGGDVSFLSSCIQEIGSSVGLRIRRARTDESNSPLFVILFGRFFLARRLRRRRCLPTLGGIPELDAYVSTAGSRFAAIQLAAVICLVRANRINY